MTTDPFKKIASYYDDLVEKYGHDPRACDYGHAKSQEIKFHILSEAMNLDGKSVLDVGCGFADFSVYLQEQFKQARYTGIDVSERMVQEAKRLRGYTAIHRANILQLPQDETFDLVTANGIFYLLGPEAPALMHKIIPKMYDLCRHAVAFTTLSSWAADQEPGEYYADPLETIAFCRRITPWVVLRHDYHPRDFAVYLYRGRCT